MKKQRGAIAIGWLYLAGAIALILALTGLVMAWNSYTEGLDKKGYDRGVSETTATWTKRDNVALQATLAAQKAAEVRVAQAEANAAQAQSYATGQYEKGMNDGKVKTAALVAAARSGTFRLQDPGQTRAITPCSAAIGPASTATSASGGDGHDGGGGLSAEASEFLLSEGGRANALVKKLNLARAVIVSDRVLCNGQQPPDY